MWAGDPHFLTLLDTGCLSLASVKQSAIHAMALAHVGRYLVLAPLAERGLGCVGPLTAESRLNFSEECSSSLGPCLVEILFCSAVVVKSKQDIGFFCSFNENIALTK